MSTLTTETIIFGSVRWHNEKQDYQLDEIADVIETTWNDHIRDSSGNYEMTCNTSYEEIDLSGSTSDGAADLQDEAQEQVDSDYYSYDAALVIDTRSTSSDANGWAGVGLPNTESPDSYNPVAGQSSETPVGYVGSHLTNALPSHEMTHMYGGIHKHHEHWGTSEYTVMGNPETDTCPNGYTGWYRRRTDEYGGCTVDDVRYYMDEWSYYFD